LSVIVVVTFFSKFLLGVLAIFIMADNTEKKSVREVLFSVRDCSEPDRKQNFMHTLCSLLSAIIKIAKPPSRHLEKKATTIKFNVDRHQATDC
jgi:hypothetical protein